MKKLILLLLIPIISYSQTFEEVLSINSLNSFKKVMIENNYQFDIEEEDGHLNYGYGLVKDEEGSKSQNWGSINKNNLSWILQFNKKDNFVYEYGYEYYEITKNLKEKCTYLDVFEDDSGNDYVCYSCEDAKWKFDGVIGFNVVDDIAFVKFFVIEELRMIKEDLIKELEKNKK